MLLRQVTAILVFLRTSLKFNISVNYNHLSSVCHEWNDVTEHDRFLQARYAFSKSTDSIDIIQQDL